ncbi:hypothetical protein DAPPUDRAFT_257547 [Daphnia pulex]|uniref:Uncharacterized protein n=1 Tax=Daphnia pulex TaxID=6669 RepID=E9HDT4_DAPPU|nr:hypothetical protein DAPPUDRAFT_257547 [Daphnia pulex]|eukprot:EFX70116.1 hypothetical protein DAPPUDRAFT_257547 [Daphnia pulex]
MIDLIPVSNYIAPQIALFGAWFGDPAKDPEVLYKNLRLYGKACSPLIRLCDFPLHQIYLATSASDSTGTTEHWWQLGRCQFGLTQRIGHSDWKFHAGHNWCRPAAAESHLGSSAPPRHLQRQFGAQAEPFFDAVGFRHLSIRSSIGQRRYSGSAALHFLFDALRINQSRLYPYSDTIKDAQLEAAIYKILPLVAVLVSFIGVSLCVPRHAHDFRFSWLYALCFDCQAITLATIIYKYYIEYRG